MEFFPRLRRFLQIWGQIVAFQSPVRVATLVIPWMSFINQNMRQPCSPSKVLEHPRTWEMLDREDLSSMEEVQLAVLCHSLLALLMTCNSSLKAAIVGELLQDISQLTMETLMNSVITYKLIQTDSTLAGTSRMSLSNDLNQEIRMHYVDILKSSRPRHSQVKGTSGLLIKQ